LPLFAEHLILIDFNPQNIYGIRAQKVAVAVFRTVLMYTDYLAL
jgi:hypothetical protein